MEKIAPQDPIAQRSFEDELTVLSWTELSMRNAGDNVAEARADDVAQAKADLIRNHPDLMRNLIERRKGELTEEEYNNALRELDELEGNS